MDKAKYLDLLKKVHWKNEIDYIQSLLKPAINITASNDFKSIEIGQSKFGGTPDLPNNIEWPKSNENNPLAFLCQINLSEIKHLDEENILPNKGIIYFFIDEPSNFTLEHKVLYLKNTDKVKPRNFPNELSKESQFKPKKMIFNKIYSLPAIDSYEIRYKNIDDYDAYMDLEEEFFIYDNNQILGYPYPLQNNVIFDWIIEYLKIPYSQIYNFNRNDVKKLYEKHNDFVNLFQFSTENSISEFWDNFNIYSMGYFGIRKKDLLKSNFNETVLIFQYD